MCQFPEGRWHQERIVGLFTSFAQVHTVDEAWASLFDGDCLGRELPASTLLAL